MNFLIADSFSAVLGKLTRDEQTCVTMPCSLPVTSGSAYSRNRFRGRDGFEKTGNVPDGEVEIVMGL